LENAGYEIVWATDGRDAVTDLDTPSLRLSALVTDIDLGPGPSGFDVADHARARRPGLPVVYVTGDIHGQFEQRRVAGGVLLTKPYSPREIVAALTSLTRSKH
jgi:DNA-binding response OmpR family regulator